MIPFKKIELSQIPEYSPWPDRILGLSPWKNRSRDSSYVKQEYEQKWGNINDAYAAIKNKGIETKDLLSTLIPHIFHGIKLFHIGNDFYITEDHVKFWAYYHEALAKIITKHAIKPIKLVELGCGWGINLIYMAINNVCECGYGFDYTQLGTRTGRTLSNDYNLNLHFDQFDFNNFSSSIAPIISDSVVITINAIEQLPNIKYETIEKLASMRPKVVIHIEPIFEHHTSNSLEDKLFTRYTIINDYNKNLLSVLKTAEQNSKIKITEETVNAMGVHALNPCSCIVWKPCN